MFYYLYEIRNKLNGKKYVGVHKTDDMNDGYMGSGKVLKLAVQKHGIENFEKIILEMFEDDESMFAREKEVVTEEFLARDDVYNLRRGGYGGFDHVNSSPATAESRRRGGIASNNWLRENKKGMHDPNRISIFHDKDVQQEMTNRAMTPAAIAKRRATYAERGHAKGDSNSQFGTCWIWHELIGNKKCKKDMLPLFIEQGWIKGRMGR